MFAEACNALWALSSLRVAVESGMFESLASGPRAPSTLARDARLDEVIVTRVLDVLVAYGLLAHEGGVYTLTDQGRTQAARGDALRADIAGTFGQTRALVKEAGRGTVAPGWRHLDPEVIRSQAALSYDVAMRMARPMKEAWPDLAALLEREGAVLVDVGVGGAGGSIAFCKSFPKLRVVGIDPLPLALIEARVNVAQHGMKERIELRAQRGDELTDEHAFDVAFLPAQFLNDEAFVATLERLKTALKPDGAIMTAAWRDVGESRASAVSRLRVELWGAGPRTAADATKMLERAGYRDIRVGPPSGDIVPIVARR